MKRSELRNIIKEEIQRIQKKPLKEGMLNFNKVKKEFINREYKYLEDMFGDPKNPKKLKKAIEDFEKAIKTIKDAEDIAYYYEEFHRADISDAYREVMDIIFN